MPAAMTESKKKATRKAAKAYARKKVDAVFAKSELEDYTDEFPRFDKEELSLGKVLGKGGFCTVNEVKGVRVAGVSQQQNRGEDDEELDIGEIEGREFIAEHCIRNGGDARYAIKYLSKENIEDTAMFIQGIKDMALETRFLSGIEHPNIIKMRAVATVDPLDETYFIVMDRLYDTLEKRMKKWERKQKNSQGLAGKLSGGKKKLDKLMEDRLVAAFDLSAALGYLHSNNIVYRDLKPENIGFDIRGDIKIFDFGLAKEVLPEMQVDGTGTYRMTGDTGSLRYMAPEVFLGKPYNFTVDTYSFCIMFWGMLALETPFLAYTVKSFSEKVHKGGKRPFVKEEWPVPLKLLLRKGWSEEIRDRPSMENVTRILKKEVVRVRDGDESGLEHTRRRSTFVFRKSIEG